MHVRGTEHSSKSRGSERTVRPMDSERSSAYSSSSLSRSTTRTSSHAPSSTLDPDSDFSARDRNRRARGSRRDSTRDDNRGSFGRDSSTKEDRSLVEPPSFTPWRDGRSFFGRESGSSTPWRDGHSSFGRDCSSDEERSLVLPPGGDSSSDEEHSIVMPRGRVPRGRDSSPDEERSFEIPSTAETHHSARHESRSTRPGFSAHRSSTRRDGRSTRNPSVSEMSSSMASMQIMHASGRTPDRAKKGSRTEIWRVDKGDGNGAEKVKVRVLAPKEFDRLKKGR